MILNLLNTMQFYHSAKYNTRQIYLSTDKNTSQLRVLIWHLVSIIPTPTSVKHYTYRHRAIFERFDSLP